MGKLFLGAEVNIIDPGCSGFVLVAVNTDNDSDFAIGFFRNLEILAELCPVGLIFIPVRNRLVSLVHVGEMEL